MRTLRKLRILWILIVGTALAMPSWAAEAAHGEGGGSVNPFSGDIGNVVWTVVIFGLVLFVLGKFAWGPILSGLQAREDFIREALEKAHRDRVEAEAKLKEYLDKIDAARAEASSIVEEGRRDADVLRRKIEEGAKVEAEKIVERGKREIAIATDTAVKDLYTKSARLATEIAQGILGREIGAQDHDRLIEQAIARLDQGETKAN